MQYMIQWDYKLKTEVETRESLCSLASPSSLVNDLWPGSNHLRSGCYLGINPGVCSQASSSTGMQINKHI